MDEQAVIYPYNGILLSNTRFGKMQEFQSNYNEQSILSVFIYIKF